MKFSFACSGMTCGKFVQRNVRARIDSADEWKTVGSNEQCSAVKIKKIVYFKYDAKDEQNRSIRGRVQLPIWRNGESLPEFLRRRWAKIVDETTDALNESILSFDLIESCFVFDFKRLKLPFVTNPKLFRCRVAGEARGS